MSEITELEDVARFESIFDLADIIIMDRYSVDNNKTSHDQVGISY